jgi:outer membrane protein
VDNSRIDRLQNVSDANELGAFGGFEINNWFVSLEFLADIGNAYDGWLASARGGYNWAVSQSWTLSFGLSTTYASDDFMNTYFGIDAANAARSGLSEYDADEGFKDVGFDLGIICRFTNHWSGRFIGRYTRLIGDADDSSPVTDQGSVDQFFGGFLVIYIF